MVFFMGLLLLHYRLANLQAAHKASQDYKPPNKSTIEIGIRGNTGINSHK